MHTRTHEIFCPKPSQNHFNASDSQGNRLKIKLFQETTHGQNSKLMDKRINLNFFKINSRTLKTQEHNLKQLTS